MGTLHVGLVPVMPDGQLCLLPTSLWTEGTHPVVFPTLPGQVGMSSISAQGFPPSLSQQSMKVQEAIRQGQEQCLIANFHLLLFLLEPKISLSEADLVASGCHKAPSCSELAGGRNKGVEPQQGRSLSCSNGAVMFSLGPCQVLGRWQVIQLGAASAPGFSGKRLCRNAEIGRLNQPPTCLGVQHKLKYVKSLP